MDSSLLRRLWVAAILILVASPVQAQSYMIGDLQPGPHAVGFTAVHEYDYSRSYKEQYDDDGRVLKTETPRPMQIAIWYPAQASANATYMPYKEYVYLDATKEVFRELSEADKLMLDQAFVNTRTFGGPQGKLPVQDLLHQYLNQATTAIHDAPAVSGSFPLVIYSPREYRGILTNTQLAEYLASHGYIVATTPNKDRQEAVVQSALSMDALQANIGDVRFVKAYMRSFPNVDMEKIGVAGWAHGMMPALHMAFTDPSVDAIVSLDGNQQFSGNISEQLPYFQPANLETPLLHFASTQQGQPTNMYFFDQMQYADAYHVALTDAFNSFAFSSYFNLVFMKSLEDEAFFNYAAADQGYDAVNVYTLRFLNAYLKGDTEAKSFLQRDPGGHHMPADLLTITRKKGIQAPPTERFFTNVFNNEGAERAREVWDMTGERLPGYKIATSTTLNALGYQYITNGELEKAMVALEMQVEAYPELTNAWDSLGEIYMANEEEDKAIESFKKALSMMPLPANVRQNSLSLLSQLGIEYDVPAREYPTVAFSEDQIADLIGTYQLNPNVTNEVKWDDGQPTVTFGNGQTVNLTPLSKNEFLLTQPSEMLITFQQDASGKVQGVEYNNGFATFSAPKVND